jgi:hypothetical protein
VDTFGFTFFYCSSWISLIDFDGGIAKASNPGAYSQNSSRSDDARASSLGY